MLSNKEKRQILARVTKGFNWLNKFDPGWQDRVDIKTLDMWNCHKCILGQVFGSYDTELIPKEIDKIAFGFEVMYAYIDLEEEYNYLRRAWIAKMRKK